MRVDEAVNNVHAGLLFKVVYSWRILSLYPMITNMLGCSMETV